MSIEKCYWNRPRDKYFYSDKLTIAEAALFSLSLNTQRIIQIDDVSKSELTAGELLQQSRTIAINLIKLGLEKGDVVGIFAGNVSRLKSVILAALLCGAPINPLYTQFDKVIINSINKVTQPKIIFCEIESYATIKAACDDIDLKATIFTLNGKMDDVASVEQLLHAVEQNLDEYVYPCSALNADDTAVIMCSSGTTGAIKSITKSHKSLLDSGFFRNRVINEKTTLITFGHPHLISGMFVILTPIIYSIKAIITTRPYTPEYLCQLAEKYAITHVYAASFQANQFAKNIPERARERMRSVQIFTAGGSKIPQFTIEKMNENLQGIFVAGYAMTELDAFFASNYCTILKPQSIGKISSAHEIRIVKKDGQQAAANETGMLHVKLRENWRGYYKDPAATKQKLTDDGWLLTNDLLYYDEDGFLYVCARNNDVFKSNNLPIYPEMIEDVLFRMPGIAEACVFGVPDFTADYLTACAIVRKKGETLLSSEMIQDFVAKNLSSAYNLRGGVYFVESLPKTGSEKILRRDVIKHIKELQ